MKRQKCWFINQVSAKMLWWSNWKQAQNISYITWAVVVTQLAEWWLLIPEIIMIIIMIGTYLLLTVEMTNISKKEAMNCPFFRKNLTVPSAMTYTCFCCIVPRASLKPASVKIRNIITANIKPSTIHNFRLSDTDYVHLQYIGLHWVAPVWPNVEIKSCPIFPKVCKRGFNRFPLKIAQIILLLLKDHFRPDLTKKTNLVALAGTHFLSVPLSNFLFFDQCDLFRKTFRRMCLKKFCFKFINSAKYCISVLL